MLAASFLLTTLFLSIAGATPLPSLSTSQSQCQAPSSTGGYVPANSMLQVARLPINCSLLSRTAVTNGLAENVYIDTTGILYYTDVMGVVMIDTSLVPQVFLPFSRFQSTITAYSPGYAFIANFSLPNLVSINLATQQATTVSFASLGVTNSVALMCSFFVNECTVVSISSSYVLLYASGAPGGLAVLLDPATLAVKATLPFSNATISSGYISLLPNADGSVLYMRDDFHTYAYSVPSLTLLWEHAESDFSSTMFVSPAYIFIYNQSSTVNLNDIVALDPSTGTEVWRGVNLNCAIAAIAPDCTILCYNGGPPSTISAIAMTTPPTVTQLFQSTHVLAIDSNNIALIASGDYITFSASLSAVDLSNPSTALWTQHFTGFGGYGPAVASSNLFFNLLPTTSMQPGYVFVFDGAAATDKCPAVIPVGP